jgi:hypothetical protein
MSADLRARSIKFEIGIEDWTNWVESWQFAYNPVDPFDTVFKVTGQVTLSLPTTNDDLPSNPDRRFNPTQWARGQSCKFLISPEYLGSYPNILPSLSSPPPLQPIWAGNALKLLRIPNAPFPDAPGGERKLTLDLGCVFALEDWDEPAADKSGITPGVSTPREIVLANILTEIGFNTDFSIMPYPLTFPAAKLKGSFVAQVGEIAASAGHGLYVDVNGDIKNFPIDLTNLIPIRAITIGSDEEIWRPIGDISENPPSELTIAAIKINSTTPTVTTTTEIEESERISVNPQETNDPLVLTTIKQTTTTFTPFNGSFTEIEEIILEPRKVVNPSETNNIYLLTTSQVRVTRQYFNPDGSLKSETETLQLPRIIVNPDETIDIYFLTQALQKTKEFFYTNGTISLIVESQLVPRKKVNPADTIDIYFLTDEFKIRTTFSKISGDIFSKTVTLEEPRIKLNPAITNNIYLLTTSSVETLVTSDGSATPPATNFRDPDSFTEEQPIKATIIPTLPPYLDGGRSRKVTIDLDYVTSVSQLQEFGRNYLRILLGRNYSWQLQCPIFDEFLTALPLSPIQINDGSISWLGYLDNMEIRGSINESYFTAVFIENGSVTPTWSV